MNERQAIAKMRRGDMDGLAFMVETYQLKAVRAATLITRDKALAEDVVQATFIRIYKKIHQFDPLKPFAPYFMRSVTNAAIQAAKKHQRVFSLDTDIVEDVTFEDMLVDNEQQPAKALDRKERQEMVREALDQLTPEQRAAVVMRYYLDMSESEMASELDMPKGTIKWRLHEARKRLKGFLQGMTRTAVSGEGRHG